MQEVSGPVVAIALILAAVFVPTAFIPGITGRLYQQFAVTIAVSVVLSASMRLRSARPVSPSAQAEEKGTGPLQRFYDRFNKVFGRATDGYVGLCRAAVRKSFFSLILLAGVAVIAGLLGKALPGSFLPEKTRGT